VAEIVGQVITKASEAHGLYPEGLPMRIAPTAILMCEPAYFKVIDVKNPFMQGNINKTNLDKSWQQWHDLKKVFEELGHKVNVIPPAPMREDMVFTANQVLLGQDKDGPYVVLARMVHQSRQLEVPYFATWFRIHNYRVLELAPHDAQHGPTTLRFEGQGDALWHPGRELLYGAYGFRSQADVYPIMSKMLNVNIVRLHLVHQRFYHLDTAFCPLNESTVMIYPPAFDEDSLHLIGRFFTDVIEVSDEEAANFACNALPLGEHIVIQKGSSALCARLAKLGFTAIEVETSEFMKSGGSVSCLKLLMY
jgi:N-dimethylarginine dimethylaminohydrolase